MAFDGICVANLVYELNRTIVNGKINKIAQPEADELLISIKNQGKTYRLDLSASPSLPFAYLTETNKPSPMTAPTFCMVLRKHILSGRILSVSQPGLERIINIEIEHLNELGDLCRKILVVELMGKHSNIIFLNDDKTIIDSIKRIPSSVSSVREVLPGRRYFIPEIQGEKYNLLRGDAPSIAAVVSMKPTTVTKAIYTSFTGISPVMAEEFACRAGLDGGMPVASCSEDALLHLGNTISWAMDAVREGAFSPCIVRRGKEPVEFAPLKLSMYQDLSLTEYSSISEVLENYYAERSAFTRVRQKSTDLRRVVSNALERDRKKLDMLKKQVMDAGKKEKYKVYGELIQAYGYGLPSGSAELICENYYDGNQKIRIPLDPTLPPQENAKKYFERYSKLKRTARASEELLQSTRAQIDHLESIQTSLEIALSADDLAQIREELMEYGFIRRQKGGKKEKIKSRPFHYISSDGFHIFVGKNNLQNDLLTFKTANGGDWWFHAKGIPGSHVIVQTDRKELPDRTFEEAARLAGYYSRGRENEKLEIDYLLRKNVKKPAGAAPGFVVYYTNYSMVIQPDISGIELVES